MIAIGIPIIVLFVLFFGIVDLCKRPLRVFIWLMTVPVVFAVNGFLMDRVNSVVFKCQNLSLKGSDAASCENVSVLFASTYSWYSLLGVIAIVPWIICSVGLFAFYALSGEW